MAVCDWLNVALPTGRAATAVVFGGATAPGCGRCSFLLMLRLTNGFGEIGTAVRHRQFKFGAITRIRKLSPTGQPTYDHLPVIRFGHFKSSVG